MPRGGMIRSYKHIPGGAQATTAIPQGSQGGYFGQLSPLTAQLNSGGPQGATYEYAYGGFLPRPAADFTEGAFGPFSPILPVPVDAPASPDTPRAAPRQYEAQVGWNLPVGRPGTEGIKLADFSTLRSLADLYSVARACIELRKNEIRGLSWDIMPTKDAAKAMRGSDKKMRDFGQRRAEAVKFFNKPDGYTPWVNWIDVVLEDLLVIDAMSILMMPKWGKGSGKGLLGSDLDSLQYVDGATIRPLIDMHGRTPRPPAPAYQQYLYGVPRSDIMTMIMEKDIENLKGLEGPDFMDMQLLYRPFTPRNWTPYGFAPIEQALIPVMSGLQKQGYQLDFFREGTVPAVYISPGGVNSNMTPNQIRELQDALNAIAGDVAWKHKIIVLPADSKVMPQKPTEIADQFDEIVMNQVCMAFGVAPMELGIMPKVSTTASPGAANQMGKESQSIQERKATKPTLEFLADIFNTILQEVCQQDDMQFTFEGLEEDEDEATQTGMLIQQIGAGLRSIDEGREELGLQPWGLPETQDPGWATGTGFVPLGQMTSSGEAAPGQQPDASNPAGQQQQQQQQQQAQPTGQQPQQSSGSAGPGNGGQSGGGAQPAKKPSGGGTGGTPAHAASQGANTESGKAVGQAHIVKFLETAVDTAPKADEHQARREAKLSSIEGKTTTALTKVVMDYRQNQITAAEATDKATELLQNGYQDVMDAGSQNAVDDGLAYQVVDNGGQAAQRAQQQRPWFMNLLKEIALGYAINLIRNRLASYSASLSPAYNEAYGQTAQASGKNYSITWHLGATEHCPLCTARDGETYTFDTLPGWPGDGGFGGMCYGGPRCGCWLSYSENGKQLAAGHNSQREAAGPYYAQQLQTIMARRQNVLDAREAFLSTLPADARVRAMTRDSIAQALAAAENEVIRANGGYSGISVEWTDVPAAEIAALVPDAMKSRAINSELEALARHFKKGRAILSWKPKHITSPMIMSIDDDVTKGLTIEQAIEIAKGLVRRVNLDGETLDVDLPDQPNDFNYPAGYPVPAGGGGRVQPAHDVEGTEIGAGRISYPYQQPEVPGAAPGGDPGGEPPRWAPYDGTSSGRTASQETRASKPEGGQDDEYPKRRGRQPSQGGGPRGGAPEQSSIGTGQAPASSTSGVVKGEVSASVVRNLMLRNFPAKALMWLSDATWSGPVDVPIDEVDWDAAKTWATAHQEGKVDKFKADIESGNPPRPAIMVLEPGDPKYKIVDGHHRTTAYKQLGKDTAPAFVGKVSDSDNRWEETHSSQVHGGQDSANKYSPSQPRDAHGRWTHAGGGGGGGESDGGYSSGIGKVEPGDLKASETSPGQYGITHGPSGETIGHVTAGDDGLTVTHADGSKVELNGKTPGDALADYHNSKYGDEKPATETSTGDSFDAHDLEKTAKPIDNWHADVRTRADLSPGDDAIRSSWIDDDKCMQLQHNLRTGEGEQPKSYGSPFDPPTGERAKSFSSAIDAIQSENTLERDSMLYRGMAVDKDFADKLQVGTVITDKAFNAVSTDMSIATNYAKARSDLGGGSEQLTFTLLTPKGTHFMPGDQGSKEIVLPRNASVHIIRRNGNNIVAEFRE